MKDNPIVEKTTQSETHSRKPDSRLVQKVTTQTNTTETSIPRHDLDLDALADQIADDVVLDAAVHRYDLHRALTERLRALARHLYGTDTDG